MTATGQVASGQRPQPVEARRRVDALSDAASDALAAYERPAVRVSVALVAGVAIILALLASAVPPLEWLGQLPWWLPIVLIVSAGAVVTAAMPLVIVPRRIVDAWTALMFLALGGRSGSQGSVGARSPDDDSSMGQDVHDQSVLQRQSLERVWLLLSAEKPDEAAQLLVSVKPTERDEAFLHAQLSWLAGFMADRDAPDLIDRCWQLAREYPDAGRGIAVAAVHQLLASEALAREGDWVEPLTEARRSLGRLAAGVPIRHMFLPRLRYYAVPSAAVAVVLIAVQMVLDAL